MDHDSCSTTSGRSFGGHQDIQSDPLPHEFVICVGSCLEQLDASQREILRMRTVLDLPYEGIAASLKISVGTVKNRVARARENLRGCLALHNSFKTDPSASAGV